jgi:dUTP pyrophosphatase
MARREAVNFVRVSELAIAPSYATPQSAGLDLSAQFPITIPQWEARLINTGLAFEIPVGHYARVAPRSGLAVHHGIHVGAGVIDEDYVGEVKVLLFNLSNTSFHITRGTRIAQLIFEKCALMEPVERWHLRSTDRGARGLGSSGLSGVTPTVPEQK